MGSKVMVSVQLDRQGRSAVVEEVMPIWVVEKAFRPIDLPDGTADGFSRFLCSDVVMVEETMKARQEIAQHLTKALLDAMGGRA